VKASSVWRRPYIEKLKAEVKLLLSQMKPTEKHEYIMQNILELEKHLDPQSQAKRFVFIMSALVNHVSHNTLKDSGDNYLRELALTILKIQGIVPGASRLSYLYSEVLMVSSQIHFKNNSFIDAAWEQQAARYASVRDDFGDEAFQSFSLAIRMMGLGHTRLAAVHYERAEQSPVHFFRARIGRIKCCRLMQDFDAGKVLIAEAKQLKGTEKQMNEILWEEALWEATQSKDMQCILNFVKRNKKIMRGYFTAEAVLWFRVVNNTQYMKRLPKYLYLAKTKVIDSKTLGALHKAIVSICECYDSKIPSVYRIRNLGVVINQIENVKTVEWRLLIWAAAARWLARYNYLALAAICLQEYQALSSKVSSGHTLDALNLMSDLFEKAWFTGQRLVINKAG
jgi:hypothetical protein